MCGIAGIFDIRGSDPVDRTLLRRMNDAIAHRGPDGEGIYSEDGVGLASRRLAIIDVARGQQPIFNEDQSVVLVFNGEIYNYQDLTAELGRRGHIFQTHSDTEVIVHAWEEWGADSVNHLRGMFAFALYDRRRHALFLARDRLGKKPLYYAIIADRFCVFGSELKALLVHPRVERKIDPIAVDDYLAFGYVPDPGTIYQGIFKLPPAHSLYLERGNNTVRSQEYWRLSLATAPVTEAAAAEILIERLSEAVRIRLMSEVPLGAFLSGGVDSSGVVAMMARESAAPVRTFTIGFRTPEVDEIPYAERVAQRYRTDHHLERIARDWWASHRRQATIFDEPFADSSSIPTFEVCRLARKHVTVALSGDAGDEVFAGYRRYRMYANTEAVRRHLPSSIRRPLFGALGELYPKLDWAPRWLRAKHTLQEVALDDIGGYYRTVCKVPDRIRRHLYTPGMKRALGDHHPADLIARHMREADTDDALARAQYVDIKTYLPGDILTKVDRASMATSLEVRVPFLDHEIVEWAATLPSALKLHGREGKYILKRALEPYVPRENLYRAKRGFAEPLASQFRGAGAQRLHDALSSDAIRDSGFFDCGALKQVIESHVSGRSDHSQVLWSLLMYEAFLCSVHSAGGRKDFAVTGTEGDAESASKARVAK